MEVVSVNMVSAEVKYLDHRSEQCYAKPYKSMMAAGMDLCAMIDSTITLEPGEQISVGTGIAIHLKNHNLVGMIYPRSGAGRDGLVLANLTGVIDPDYQGELIICLWNRSNAKIDIEPMQRVAQYAVLPKYQLNPIVVQEFSEETERGINGFNSTGSNGISKEDVPMTEQKKLHLYLTTGSPEDGPERRAAKTLGLGPTMCVQYNASLEDAGDDQVRTELIKYHNQMGVDFTIKQVKDLGHESVKETVDHYKKQGYHVHQISIV